MRTALSLFFALAACGGGDDEAAPAEGVKAAGTLDFVVWSYSIETIQDNIKRFEKANPGIKVKPVYTGTYQETIVKALTAHKSGQPPTTAILLSTDMFTLIDEDAIVPIEGIDTKVFYPAFMANSQTGGKTWGIPFQRSTIVLYWNKELFKEAGLDDIEAANWWGLAVPRGTPPEVVRKLADAFREAVKSPAAAERFRSLGVTPVAGTPEEIEAANSEDPEIARKSLEALLVKNPKNAMLLARLGNLYRTTDPNRSLDYYRQAVEIDPGNADHATGYSSALVQARRFPDAVAVLRRVLAVAPDNYAAHANLAAARAQYGLLRASRALPDAEAVLFEANHGSPARAVRPMR